MLKKALFFRNEVFHLISYLNTGYWLGEETLTYYDDQGKPAKGDLLGRIILLDDCIPIILEEFYTGIYNEEFMIVEVEKNYDFGRKTPTESFKNWVGWTYKHKFIQLLAEEKSEWKLKK